MIRETTHVENTKATPSIKTDRTIDRRWALAAIVFVLEPFSLIGFTLILFPLAHLDHPAIIQEKDYWCHNEPLARVAQTANCPIWHPCLCSGCSRLIWWHLNQRNTGRVFPPCCLPSQPSEIRHGLRAIGAGVLVHHNNPPPLAELLANIDVL